MMIPRGIRNNNPLNIRRGASAWQGLAAVQTDPDFCQFESLEWGWRAAFILLTDTYYKRYRLDTVKDIVKRWAPPADHNNTALYIANVCRLTGLVPDEPLGPPEQQPAHWLLLAAAMGIQENGSSSMDYFALLRGWQLR